MALSMKNTDIRPFTGSTFLNPELITKVSTCDYVHSPVLNLVQIRPRIVGKCVKYNQQY